MAKKKRTPEQIEKRRQYDKVYHASHKQECRIREVLTGFFQKCGGGRRVLRK